MSTIILVPLGLGLDARPAPRAGLASAWNRLRVTSGWSAWQLAQARRQILQRAEAFTATDPGYAAELRSAALGADPSVGQ